MSGARSTDTHDQGHHSRRPRGRGLVAAAAVALTAAVAVAGCSDDDDTSSATTDVTEGATDGGASAAEQVAVDIVDIEQAFQPGTVTVTAGGEVTWANADDMAHTATAEDGTWDSGSLEPGDDFVFTLDEPGTYSYICSFHPTMQGELIVE
ncbi:MAG: cupredoxin domain-containing protein [Acidimicrobiales bacterium]